MTASPTSATALFARYGPAYRWYAVVTVMLGAASMVIEATIVNVAIPGIMRHFGMGQNVAQWLSAGFLAAMTATMLLAAWCVRRFGQKHTYRWALASFVVVSCLGGVATTPGLVIASRVLQGAIAGLVQPLAMITLFEVFPPAERGRGMAVYGLGTILSPALGPAVGGYLVDLFGWRAIFFVTMPFCLAGLVLSGRFMPSRETDEAPIAFDWIGFVLLCVFLFCELDGFLRGHALGWGSAAFLLRALGALACALAFVAWELKTSHPMLELRLFAERRFSAASLVALAYGMGLYGSTFVIPLFVQTVVHYTAAQSGLLLIPGGLVLAAAITLAGRMTDRIAPHRVVIFGLVCFSLSFLLFAASGVGTAFAIYATWIAIGRVGLGAMIPSLTAGAVNVVEARDVAIASGTINFCRQLGGAIGVNLVSIVLEWRTLAHSETGGIVAAYHDTFLSLTVLFVIAMLPALRMAEPPLRPIPPAPV